MGKATGIAWTHHTWNPWQGCTKVSPGCAHCYMFRDKVRYGQDPATVVRSKPPTFNQPRTWPEPALVFTCSWSDFFHDAADAWRADAWDIIRATPHLTYQILTKRPERIAAHLPEDWGDGWGNVWLGVSVENARWVERAVTLTEIPASVRFLSCEPLLGSLLDEGEVLERLLAPDYSGVAGARTLPRIESPIHWVIAGGESGPDARPMDLQWVRGLRNLCARGGVPFFLKQLGGWPNPRAHHEAVLDGRTHTAMPIAWTGAAEVTHG